MSSTVESKIWKKISWTIGERVFFVCVYFPYSIFFPTFPFSRTDTEDSEIEATILRINAMKKKTEEEKEKTEKIKEQQRSVKSVAYFTTRLRIDDIFWNVFSIRLTELKAEEKRMKEEHEKMETQRRQAEKELAEQMRVW